MNMVIFTNSFLFSAKKQNSDLVIKKMVYLYLTNYAKTHPTLAQMCTNTLQKDCSNDDPMVRGLALRALAGLNLPEMLEYIVDPVRRSLQDGHGYVRKTAVMGCLKIYHLDASIFDESGFVDILYDMLRDPDASVVANVIIVLNEVMIKSPAGGMAINRAIMLHLLNRIHEFNEFAKVQILELVPRYIPADDEEGYQIMNLLDPVLRTTDSGATMATIKAFLSLADQIGDDPIGMKRQIVHRIKAPIVTQISSGSSEIMYALLKHTMVLTEICPGVFDDEYRQFYVRYNEPTHVKYLKIAILPRLANPDTAPDIVSELAECVHDPNIKLSRLSIQSMGQIASSGQGGPGAAEAIARRMVDMLDSVTSHVSSEAACALTLMIRKHKSLETLIAPPLVRSLKYITESSGKAAIIYLLGECGEIIKEAPYAFEKLIDKYEDITDPAVKTALLTSTVKLFFIRPPEVQRMLGRLLNKATNDVSSQDLHDRALLYYRLLRSGTDYHTLATVVKMSKTVPDSIGFSEEADDMFRTELMEEFNTLSILYGKPSDTFIAPEYQVKYVKMPDDHPLVASSSTTGDNASYPATMLEPVQQQQSDIPAAAPSVPAALEFDLLGFGTGPSPPEPALPATSTSLSLSATFTMTPDEYQSKWGTIPDAEATVSMVPMQRLPANTDQVERALSTVGILTMASGELPNEFKFFLYACDSATGTVFFIQTNVEKTAEPLMVVTVKVSGEATPVSIVEKLIDIMGKALN
jgi:AP-4 complex subunit beta-1